MTQQQSVKSLYPVLRDAGRAIIEIEKSAYLDIEYKADQSPLTRADIISDIIIREALQKTDPDIPVLSEESLNGITVTQRNSFWLLDPLDGTKEFIKGNGEYCISLALIEKGRPLEAFIYWPAGDILWFAKKGEGSYKLENNELCRLPGGAHIEKNTPLVLLRSRSHYKEDEIRWYEKASGLCPLKIEEQGSAIKFCLLAEGKADFYVKKGTIYGWDIAAGDLILSESGGHLLAYGERKEIYYTYSNIEMPHFIACSKRIARPEEWLF